MIKFFRKIRYDLMKKNKTGKYIKYAIGEIILVVIGILIALQINNWNDYRKAVQDSKVYLKDMREDLAIDTAYLNRAIPIIERELDFQEWALNKTQHSLADIKMIQDSIQGGYWDFYINSRTFEKIQNSSVSNLTGFDDLFRKITYYYSVINKRMEKNTAYEVRESTIRTPLVEKFFQSVEIDPTFTRIVKGKEVKKSFPLANSLKEQNAQLLTLWNSTESRNQMRLIYGRRLFILKGFVMCKKEADSLLTSIDKALNND